MMTADTIIDQIRQLPTEEQEKIVDFVEDWKVERENAGISYERAQDFKAGKVEALHNGVFSAARAKIREA